MVFFPNIAWVVCLSGLTLGVNIAVATTYGTIITSPPYNWPHANMSYINCGQIFTALVALPLLGYWSDNFIQWAARRNMGIYEPEYRLVPLGLPIAVGVFTIILYGQGAAHPFNFHWLLYVWTVAGYFFTFVGSSVIGITYLLDSYPTRTGPCLVVVCACRSIISFAITYEIAPFIATFGYDGTFLAFGAVTALLGLLGIPIFAFGKSIRMYTGRRVKGAALE